MKQKQKLHSARKTVFSFTNNNGYTIANDGPDTTTTNTTTNTTTILPTCFCPTGLK